MKSIGRVVVGRIQQAALDKDLFLRKPIQNEELIKEINRMMASN